MRHTTRARWGLLPALLAVTALGPAGHRLAATPAPDAAPAARQQVRAVRRILLGKVVDGRLTRTDPRLSGNRAYHLWLFTSDADRAVLIEMISGGVEPYVVLQEAGGHELARDANLRRADTAVIRFDVRAGVQYRVLAASRRANRHGTYTLRVTEAPPERVRRIALDQEATDRLVSDDPRLPSNRPYHTWLFAGDSGQRVVIEMLSSDVDARLIVQDSAGTELARDDDSGERNNARLDYTLPAHAEYRILANGYRANRFGAYTLRVTAAPPERVRRIALGQEANDRLTSADPRMPRNRPYHTWLFTGEAGRRVVIEMNSSAVDPHLILRNAAGEQLARDDDGGEGKNARIDFTLPDSGEYRIIADGFRAGRFGAYTLRLTEAPPERVRRIAIGEEANDRLVSSDPRLPTNRPYHTWRFAGTAGQFVMIEMLSTDLDSHVILQDSSGTELAKNDDSGEGSNARLRYTLPATGEYRILANSFRANRYGPYTLRVTEGGELTTDMEGVRGSIARGQTRRGTLKTGDAVRTAATLRRIVNQTGRTVRLEIGQRKSEYHAYLYTATAGEELSLSLRSPSIDVLLIVQEADGERLASNDDGGEGTNARLTYTFPYAGTFRIVAGTAAGTRLGSYELTVR